MCTYRERKAKPQSNLENGEFHIAWIPYQCNGKALPKIEAAVMKIICTPVNRIYFLCIALF